MAKKETQSNGSGGEMQLTGNVLLYTNPEPLSFDAHSKLGVKRLDRPFEFLAKTNVMPLTVNEFGVACGSFPIIFAGSDRVPLAVMGIRKEENLLVDADGQFERNLYVPAYVRRYPFIFANDDENQKMILCIDRGAEAVTTKSDIPFFEGEKPSKYTDDAIAFCKEFERQRQATLQFVQIAGEHDLFEEKTVNFQPQLPDGSQGEPQKIADYLAISEEKLNSLDAATLVKLRDNGVLQACYAHLLSLIHWPRLIQTAMVRSSQEAEQAGQVTQA